MKKLTSAFWLHYFKILVLADQAVSSGSNFLFFLFLARNAGLEKLGEFSLIWMTALVANSFQQAWIIGTLQNSTLFESKKITKQSVHVLQAAFIMVTAILIMLFFLGMHWLELVDTYLLLVAILGYLSLEYYRKYMVIKAEGLRVLSMDVITALLLLTAVNYIPINSLRDILLIVGIAYCPALIMFLNAFVHAPFDDATTRLLRFSFWDAKWRLGVSSLQWFSGNFIIVAASTIGGPLMAGSIRMAQNVMGILNVVFLAVDNYFPSVLMTIYMKSGQEKVTDYVKKFTLKAGLVMGCVLTGLFVTAHWLIPLLYHTTEALPILILQCFCVLYMLIFLGYPVRYLLRIYRLERYLFVGYVLSAIFSFFYSQWMPNSAMAVAAGLITGQFILISTGFFSLKFSKSL
jgi:O-antigen/teichoic acid export membrane protein